MRSVVRARLAAVLAGACCAAGAPREFSFEVRRDSEVVMEIGLRSPGSDWAKSGHEAAVAEWTLDGDTARGHIMVWSGEQTRRYALFLGALSAGRHLLRVDRDATHSAAGSELEVQGATFREFKEGSDGYDIVANAPVLFARANTVGRFTDVPLFTYAERLMENGTPVIQYTVVFSNEDGGTNTRALMARWGRTTDIEYVYRAYLDGGGRAARSIIQTRDHKDVEFTGPRDGRHPLLIPVTDNNMVAAEGSSALRYQLAPATVDLANASREQVMDDEPLAYRVMVAELEREGKLRPWGTIDGSKVGDPRNYLYVEARVANQGTRLATLVRLRGESRWRSSDTGIAGAAIERSGWVRTTVELPPSTKPQDIAEIGFQCLAAEKSAGGVCRVEGVRKAFFLDSDCAPQASFWSLAEGREILSGEMVSWTLR